MVERLYVYNWQHEHRAARVMLQLRPDAWTDFASSPEDECLDAPESIPAGNLRVNANGVQIVRMVRREPITG